MPPHWTLLLPLLALLLACSQAEPQQGAAPAQAYTADSAQLAADWPAHLQDAKAQATLTNAWMRSLGTLDTATILTVGTTVEGPLQLFTTGADTVIVWAPDSLIRSALLTHSWQPSQQGRVVVASSSWDTLPQPWLAPGHLRAVILQEVLHRMPNRVRTLRALLPALADNGLLIAVEPRPGANQPSLTRPQPYYDILTDLRHAGFRHFSLDSTRLPTHYILTAR